MYVPYWWGIFNNIYKTYLRERKIQKLNVKIGEVINAKVG